MKYDEIEESIQVIANYTLENYTFYNIACETGKKHENTNSPISLFSFILQRLSINENGKCCKDIYFKEKIKKRKRDIKSSLEVIKSANLNDYYIKDCLNNIIKSTGYEYDVELFINILKSIEVEFSKSLEEGRVELKTKRDLIKEDELIETIMSTQIIKNLCKNDYPHLEKILRNIWALYFIPNTEFTEENLSRDIEIIFIRNLEFISIISKELLQKINSKESIYGVLEKTENEKVPEIYLFAIKTILKNFPYHKEDIHSYNGKLYRYERLEDGSKLYDENEIEITTEFHKYLMERKDQYNYDYSLTASDLKLMLAYEEKHFFLPKERLFSTLSNYMEIIIAYFKENPLIRENLNNHLHGITFDTCDFGQIRVIDDSLDFLKKKLNSLKNKKSTKQTTANPVTTKEVQEAIKYVVNNYMASIDFYSCLLKLREEKLWYGLNISRFRLTLIEMYNLLELENIKEKDPKKTLKL